MDITKKLAKEYNLPIRQREQIIEDYPYVPVYDQMYNEDVNYEFFTQVLTSKEGALEFMCHPAYLDQRLYDMTSYSIPRMKELELLTSDKVKQFIHDHHIQLINYSDLHQS